MPSISAKKSVARSRFSLLPGFLLLLLFISFGGWLAEQYYSDTHLSQQYHHAPGCFPGARTDPSLPPCRNATLLVTRRWGSDDNLLNLAEPGDDPQTETVNDRVWQAAPVGSKVTGQIWKGQIMRVWAGGQVSRTDDNPDHDKRLDAFMLGEYGFVLLLGMGFLPAALSNWFRQVRGLPASPESAYAIRVQGDRLTLSARRYTRLSSLLFGLMMLGGTALFTCGLVLFGHDLLRVSWPILAAALGALGSLAWLGRRSKSLAFRLPYLLLLIPVLLGRAAVSTLGSAGRILLFGDRWTFDRARDRIQHNDRPVSAPSDIANVQVQESKSARGRLRRSLRLAAKDGAEIGEGVASDADAEETEYVAQRLADFLGAPLQRLLENDEEADAEQAGEQKPVVPTSDSQRLEVPYTSTFADLWRTNVYFSRRWPWVTLYNLLALPVAGACLWLPPYLHRKDYLGAVELLALMLAGNAALVAALTLLYILPILARRGADRGSRFIVGADGYEDVMLGKTTAVLWREVTAVEEHAGDLYLFRRDAKKTYRVGTFLPRSAFAGPDEAKAFHASVVSLWEQGKGLSDVPTIETGV